MPSVPTNVPELPASFKVFSQVLNRTNTKLRSKNRDNHGHNRAASKTRTEEFFKKNPDEKVYAFIAEYDNAEGSYYITDTADTIRIRPDQGYIYLYDANGEQLFAEYDDENGIKEIRRVNKDKEIRKKSTSKRVHSVLATHTDAEQNRPGENFTDAERDSMLARAQKMLETFMEQK